VLILNAAYGRNQIGVAAGGDEQLSR
jgi:hypothetical protein